MTKNAFVPTVIYYRPVKSYQIVKVNMSRFPECKQGDELGGKDPEDHNPKQIADERKEGHYSNKGGHGKRGDGQDKPKGS